MFPGIIEVVRKLEHGSHTDVTDSYNYYYITTVNKNALSSCESGLLGDKFYCQLVLLCYFFVWNTKRVLYVIM